MTAQQIQAQVNEVTQFATWLAGAMFLLLIGRTVGGMEKNFVNSVLDMATPESIPVRIPQTKVVTVTCPICGKVIEIPEYNSATRSEALKRHIEKEHTSKVGLHPQILLIEGDPIPPQYRDLFGHPRPLPESALSVEYLPAIDPEERRRRIEALSKKLKDGVQRIQSSDEFRNFLVAMARFHTYSWNNQLLIMLQKPQATHVAGFNTWKDLGRWVRAGETGIQIFAPRFPAVDIKWVRHTDGATWRIERIDKEWGIYHGGNLADRFKTRRAAERQLQEWGATEERIVGAEVTRFLIVHVFDISQTDGKPLPEFEVPVLAGEVNEELFTKLKILMQHRGVSVSFESRPYMDPGIKGQFIAPNQIWVRPEEPGAQQLKTLLHEVAHYYSEGVFRIPRADAETIAESAAYVIGAHYGFDTGVRSFPYVALWAKEDKVMDQNLDAIHNVVQTILEDFEPYGLEKSSFALQTHHSIPRDDLKRIAEEYGWWAARQAEALCPHNDVACVEREARRLVEVVRHRRGGISW